ncbi:MAG: oligosaccharide repeat unit polymerase [Acidobacteria bacterium]|nr:oligosaccharide repeat unit polymerase [Acidobacteriota bacterium]
MIRPTSAIWWLHPAFPFAAAGVGISVAAHLIPESTYRTYWRAPKFFDWSTLEVALLCVAVFVFGSWWGTRLTARGRGIAIPGPEERGSWNLMAFLFRLSFWLCLSGYALWTALAIRRGITWSVVMGVLTGEKGAMYDARFTYLPTVGGITTLTQFGIAVMILGAIIGFSHGWRTVRFKCGAVFLIAVFRALLNSERFALIELAVPFLVTGLAVRYFDSPKASPSVRILLRFAPFIGVATLFVLFTGFEYFRSWTNYYAGRDQTLVEFGAMRLLGYYVTSFNNGAYLLQRLETLSAPYFSLHFLWGFPLTGPLIKRLFPNPLLDSSEKWFYFPFLESEANVEFNNAGGMLFPLLDFGVPGGLLYWLLLGLICGAVYQMFRRKELPGLFLYPIVYLGLLEVPLALYWGEGRAFPSLCLMAGAPAMFSLIRGLRPRPARAAADFTRAARLRP